MVTTIKRKFNSLFPLSTEDPSWLPGVTFELNLEGCEVDLEMWS